VNGRVGRLSQLTTSHCRSPEDEVIDDRETAPNGELRMMEEECITVEPSLVPNLTQKTKLVHLEKTERKAGSNKAVKKSILKSYQLIADHYIFIGSLGYRSSSKGKASVSGWSGQQDIWYIWYDIYPRYMDGFG